MNTATMQTQAETTAYVSQDPQPKAAYVTSEEERRLIEKCKAGDMDAWDVLVHKYEKSVYRFAYSLCRNHDDAADIAGHVFVRLYKNLHTFRYDSSFASWLCRIVRNAHIDLCVRPASRKVISLDADSACDTQLSQPSVKETIDPGPSPEAQYIRKDIAGLLAHAVKHLPTYQREVVRMFHIDGKSYEEISTAMGLSIGTVKSRLNRARTMLRERLLPYKDMLVSA